MPQFRITQYEICATDYIVEADSEAEAVTQDCGGRLYLASESDIFAGQWFFYVGT